jgi:putative transposase
MVRSGIVEHPSQWPFCGYNEIQEPKRKNVLIDYEKLRASLGLESYDLVKSYHRKWVEEYLGNGKKIREDKWSASIAACPVGLIDRTGVKCCT